MERNEPCSCGSGKKYKKCCMNVVNRYVGSESFNNDLLLGQQLLKEFNAQLDLWKVEFDQLKLKNEH